MGIEGEQRPWEKSDTHLGCEGAGALCMYVSDGGGQFDVALEVHISFPCREDGI